MKHEQITNLQAIINTYGIQPQVDMAIEECSELIQALLKYRRKPSFEGIEAIIDELADVEIMVQQMKLIFDGANETEKRIEYKINRQIERMKKHE